MHKDTTAKLASPIAPDSDDRATLRQVAGFCHATLKDSPEALKYLESRGLTHPEMIDHFQLGFANRKLGLTLPDKNRKAGAEMRGRLQRLGILRESGPEHFNGSVVFPIRGVAGDVLGMYGRKITPGLREGTPLHMYLPGPHPGVWNEEALAASKEIVLCESILDALTFWCAGFHNVTASYGVNGFTDDHRAAFLKYGARKVSIAYDRDEAGDGAAAKLAEELIAMGIECHRVLFPHGMDANEYVLAGKNLGTALNQAEWIGKGQCQAAKEQIQPPPIQTSVIESVFSLAAETAAGEIAITFEDRRYRVRGLAKNLGPELMKINLLASRSDAAFHVDTLDLYSARQRSAFQKQAAIEMNVKEDVVKRDLGRVLLKLEELQQQQIRETLKPKLEDPVITEEDRQAALELLKDPKLLDRILIDFTRCGVVGEETNKLAGYIAAISRHLEAPLAVIVQSSSAAGKSSLMESILAFIPEEQRVQYSAMTGQSLFYMGETELKHKVLAIVEEEGASRAAYALKLLQSEGVLTIASTGKDPSTGRLLTHQYRVEGPVMIFLTTTAIDLDEELLNRCLVLTVNEDRAQTQAIHRLQREQQTLEGMLARRERDAILKLHRNAQRLLKPVPVVNPYARELTFLDSLTRSRRDHGKYLALIRSLALLHQHQRPLKTHRGISYIEATLEDVENANRIAHEVLGRSLDDLPPQTRKLLLMIEEIVKVSKIERADFRFTRRDVRAHTGWSDSALKKHLARIEDLEYVAIHRGGRGQSMVYELVFESGPDPAKPRMPGLIDVDKLKKSPPSHPQVTQVSWGGHVAVKPMNAALGAHYAAAEA